MPTALITGANRGIGLEFVRSLAADGWRVHACCRLPDRARELKDIEGDVVRHRLDVTDGLRIESLARELADEPIDLLLNNAGIYGPRHGLGETDYDAWLDVFHVNTMAPLRLIECFIDQVVKSERKLIVNISSGMGSISKNTSGGNHIYRSSKAALNMIVKGISVELSEQGVVIVVIDPGWVRTDMGGPNATVSAAESVAGMRQVIEQLTPKNTGGFLNRRGEEVAW